MKQRIVDWLPKGVDVHSFMQPFKGSFQHSLRLCCTSYIDKFSKTMRLVKLFRFLSLKQFCIVWVPGQCVFGVKSPRLLPHD